MLAHMGQSCSADFNIKP